MSSLNLTDSISKSYLLFSWIDYSLFGLLYGFSAIIGVYYGCFGNKQSTTEDYLHGGKKMNYFPVAMSLTASNLSGITLLGIPAEMYFNGKHQYSMCVISAIIQMILLSSIYLPVFYNLQLTSAYEYLEKRFSHKIRLTASALFVVTTFLYMPIVVYVPALAFNQVTGFDIRIITPIVSMICIFYTTIGGLKAVVWTDTLQFSITSLTLGFVLIMGTISVGGFTTIWTKSSLGGRLEFFNMDPDPTIRQSFWSIAVGNTFHWMGHAGCNPATIQRFMALPTRMAARKSLLVYGIATIITKLMICFCGLILFAKYFDCDPLTSGNIAKPDQILPYFVMDVAKTIPGIGGLFVAGVFSTAFSTLSTFLNTLSGRIYTDFIKPFLPVTTSETKASNIMKIIVVVVGILTIALVFVVDKLGSILQLNISTDAVTLGPLLGLFTLGILFPIANEKGAISGSLSSVVILSWIVIKNQLYNYHFASKIHPKPLNTYGCNDFNITSIINSSTVRPTFEEQQEPHWLFRITFYYYVFIGTMITLSIGLLVSWFTKQDNTELIDLNLLCPFVQRFVEKSKKTDKYDKGLDTDEAENMI